MMSDNSKFTLKSLKRSNSNVAAILLRVKKSAKNALDPVAKLKGHQSGGTNLVSQLDIAWFIRLIG